MLSIVTTNLSSLTWTFTSDRNLEKGKIKLFYLIFNSRDNLPNMTIIKHPFCNLHHYHLKNLPLFVLFCPKIEKYKTYLGLTYLNPVAVFWRSSVPTCMAASSLKRYSFPFSHTRTELQECNNTRNGNIFFNYLTI